MTPPWNSSGVLGGPERRHLDRRGRERTGPERRKRNRRRRARTMFLAALMSSAPAARPMIALLPASKVLQPKIDVDTQYEVVPAKKAYEDIIQEAAQTYDLDASLIRAVMQAESAFHPYVVSRAGAEGLMQLMPALADEMGVTDSFDPRENIMGGARYLKQLLEMHNGNIALTLASYNAGPGNVRRYRGVPPFKETRSYVKKITKLLKNERDSDWRARVHAYAISNTNGAWAATLAWKNPDVTMYTSSPVFADGRIYGLSAKRRGQFVILDAATGAVKSATEGRDGTHASILIAPEHVLFLTDAGALIIAPRGSDKFVEERRYDVGNSSTWGIPVLLPDGVLVREATSIVRLLWN